MNGRKDHLTECEDGGVSTVQPYRVQKNMYTKKFTAWEQAKLNSSIPVPRKETREHGGKLRERKASHREM